MPVRKIISGADRAALDFALARRIPYGGWVPKGRKAEDGAVPDAYRLEEMPDGNYSRRTEKNVLESDGTLIVSHGSLRDGSAVESSPVLISFPGRLRRWPFPGWQAPLPVLPDGC